MPAIWPDWSVCNAIATYQAYYSHNDDNEDASDGVSDSSMLHC